MSFGINALPGIVSMESNRAKKLEFKKNKNREKNIPKLWLQLPEIIRNIEI